jgi:hypothetical protein
LQQQKAANVILRAFLRVGPGHRTAHEGGRGARPELK